MTKLITKYVIINFLFSKELTRFILSLTHYYLTGSPLTF